MQSKTAIIEADGAEFSLTVEGRNAGVLYGPEALMEPGLPFLDRIGVLENVTIARGLPVGASAVCKRALLYHASEMLTGIGA